MQGRSVSRQRNWFFKFKWNIVSRFKSIKVSALGFIFVHMGTNYIVFHWTVKMLQVLTFSFKKAITYANDEPLTVILLGRPIIVEIIKLLVPMIHIYLFYLNFVLAFLLSWQPYQFANLYIEAKEGQIRLTLAISVASLSTKLNQIELLNHCQTTKLKWIAKTIVVTPFNFKALTHTLILHTDN